MKKFLFISFLLSLCAGAFAQNPSGYTEDRGKRSRQPALIVDSSFGIPKGCGAPGSISVLGTRSYKGGFQLYGDTCNNRLYILSDSVFYSVAMSSDSLGGGSFGKSDITDIFDRAYQGENTQFNIDSVILVSVGRYGEGKTLDITGAGTRMFWYPLKAAFRVGYVTGGNWDNGNIGDVSFSAGQDNRSSGYASTSFGRSNIAIGNYSTGLGLSNYTTGSNSLVAGEAGSNTGNNSIVLGQADTSTAANTFITGLRNIAKTQYQTILGRYNDSSKVDLFQIGAGWSWDNRRNAMRIDTGGKTYLPLVAAGSTTDSVLTIDATTKEIRYVHKNTIGGGTNNTNVGSTFKLLNEGPQTIKSITTGDRITMDSNSTTVTITSVDSVASIAVKNVADLKATAYHVFTAKKKLSNEKIFVKLSGYYNPGDGGGGDFFWDDTATVAGNDGTIIAVTGVTTGRWKRMHDAKYMNLRWFGAKGDDLTASANTNRLAWYAAKAAMPVTSFTATLKSRGILYVPAGNYYFDSTLLIDGSMSIVGDEGSNGYQSTVFKFYNNKLGVFVSPNDPSNGRIGGTAYISNIGFWSQNQNIYDTTLHAIKVRSQVRIQYCSFQHFSGDGLDIFCDAVTPGSDSWGNSAFSEVYNCRFYNNRNGIHIKGGDGSIKTSLNDFTANRGWGIWNESFLISEHHNDFFHDNTYISNNYTQVVKNGIYYMAKTWSQNYPPDSTGADYYWYKIDGTPLTTYFTTWNRDTLYHGGGAMNTFHNGQNLNAGIYDIYIEGGQLFLMGPRTTQINGITDAAYLVKGADTRLATAGGKYNFYTSFGYNNDLYSQVHTEIGDVGLEFYPHSGQSNSYNPYTLYYDTTQKKLIWRYANGSFPFMKVASTLSSASDYGLPSIKLGVPEFPNGIYMHREGAGGNRRLKLGTAAPSGQEGEWGIGDIVLRTPTSTTQSLGWRLIDTTGADTWEEIPWPSGSAYTGNLPIRVTGTVIGIDTAISLVPSVTTNARLQKIIDSLSAAGWGSAGSLSGSGVANQVTLWSGTSTLTGNSNFTADPTAASAYYLNTSSSSPLGGTYYQMWRAYAVNAGNGNIIQYFYGKADNTNDAFAWQMNYSSSGSSSNSWSLVPYGGTEIVRLFAGGNTSFGSLSDIGEKLYVNGNVHVGSRFAGVTGYFGGLASPHASAVLEANSTTKGILIPKVTTTQMNAISTPATGLMVINTDTIGTAVGSGLFIYDGTAWRGIKFSHQDATGSGGGLGDPGGNGYVVRTALNTTINRTFQDGVGTKVNNGSGTAGNTSYDIKGYNDWQDVTIQTTNNTATTAITITPTNNDGVGESEVILLATKTDNTKSVVGRKIIQWSISGGTASVNQIIDVAADYVRGSSAATWTVDASSNTIRVRVTGVTSETYDWNVTAKTKWTLYAF